MIMSDFVWIVYEMYNLVIVNYWDDFGRFFLLMFFEVFLNWCEIGCVYLYSVIDF